MKNLIAKTLKLSPEKYYETHLKIISPMLPLPLSGREVEVLATFMTFKQLYPRSDMFASEIRKEVREKLNLSHGGLGNHLKSMVDKGFLIKRNKELKIREFLLLDSDTQNYQFKIIKDGKTN